MASTNRRATVAVTVGALLVLSPLAGCRLGPGGAPPTGQPTSTTAAPPIADYARQLTTDAERIRSGLAQVAGAKTYAELRTRIRAGSADITALGARWDGIATPAGTKAAHDRYLVLLAELHRWIAACRAARWSAAGSGRGRARSASTTAAEPSTSC
jgi:hypothetical protein